ncbi:MAG: hypothetical protein OJF51_003688 [Nitrospira sp.]|nr:MAG: hypothetical protein OJF51_003688 [Nitrospira sp.]
MDRAMALSLTFKMSAIASLQVHTGQPITAGFDAATTLILL